jgi:hypothetical protein
MNTIQVPLGIDLTIKMIPTNEVAKATEQDLSKPDNPNLFFELLAHASGVQK